MDESEKAQISNKKVLSKLVAVRNSIKLINPKYYIPIPLYLIATICLAFSFGFKIMKRYKFMDFFQKFYSVYEHQKIIYENSKLI